MRLSKTLSVKRKPAPVPAHTARDTLRHGHPLDLATRQLFEPKFGWNFSDVRVHTDSQSAHDLRARAFTVGDRIVFGAGRYQPGSQDGWRLIAHELTHIIQQSLDGTPRIQRSPDPDPKAPAEPTLLKTRHGDTAWIKDVSQGKTLDDKDWAKNSSDIKKLCLDAAKTAEVAKIFVGPAEVAKPDNINMIEKDAADMHHYLPGLNYSSFVSDKGETFYVDAKGGEPINKLVPNQTDPLPKIAMLLGKKALESKEVALSVLRHEMQHAEHLNLALKAAKKWIDSKSKATFEDFLSEQRKKDTELDFKLVSSTASFKTANTELLAYTEGFMTTFLLTNPPPGNNNDAAFLELFGTFCSPAEPWAYADVAVRSEMLGRLQEYFCHALDSPHQDALQHFILNPPTAMTTKADAWPWAPKRQMHEHYFAALKKMVDGKCKDLGGIKKPSTSGDAKK